MLDTGIQWGNTGVGEFSVVIWQNKFFPSPCGMSNESERQVLVVKENQIGEVLVVVFRSYLVDIGQRMYSREDETRLKVVKRWEKKNTCEWGLGFGIFSSRCKSINIVEFSIVHGFNHANSVLLSFHPEFCGVLPLWWVKIPTSVFFPHFLLLPVNPYL